MKKSLVAVALFGAFAAQAQAQSAVVIYGTVDAGVTKATGSTTAIGARNNNKLGFMGTEDLGNGLKALFQLEMRYSPDTGTLEGNGTRPLFQGQSRVGLQGAFGTVRLGRGLTAFQESSTRFEPWSGIPSAAGFQTDIAVAGYTSDPFGGLGNTLTSNSRNRFSNAVFYNTPVFSGFQANATVGTKEASNNASFDGGVTYAAGQEAFAVPYSLSATYDNGPFAAMAAYERNANETTLWSVAGSFNPMQPLKLMASYQQQDQDKSDTIAIQNGKTKAWVLGANYTMGPGKFLAGYGQKDPDFNVKTKQVSLGYEYSLSKRTYVYVDASNKKQPATSFVNGAAQGTSVNSYGVGVSHNF